MRGSLERLVGIRVMSHEQGENGMKIDVFEQKRGELLRDWETIQGRREKIKQAEKIFEEQKKTQHRVMKVFGSMFLPHRLHILNVLAGKGIAQESEIHINLGSMLYFTWSGLLLFNVGVILWANAMNAKTKTNIGDKKSAVEEDSARVRSDLITLLTTPGTIQERLIEALLPAEEAARLLALPSGVQDEPVVEGKIVSRG